MSPKGKGISLLLPFPFIKKIVSQGKKKGEKRREAFSLSLFAHFLDSGRNANSPNTLMNHRTYSQSSQTAHKLQIQSDNASLLTCFYCTQTQCEGSLQFQLPSARCYILQIKKEFLVTSAVAWCMRQKRHESSYHTKGSKKAC